MPGIVFGLILPERGLAIFAFHASLLAEHGYRQHKNMPGVVIDSTEFLADARSEHDNRGHAGRPFEKSVTSVSCSLGNREKACMKLARAYIRVVDAVNYRVGRIMMYGIFVMIGILLWSSVSKTFFLPSLWTLEIAQFALVAYYIMGGPYSIQLGSNVRMDLFYAEWSTAKKAKFDAVTVMFLIFYLGVLLYGGLGSTAYSLGHFGDQPVQYLSGLLTGSEDPGRLERSPTAWRPYLWPIKTLMCIGIFLMLLQAISELLKDIIKLREGDA